jgi:hypothetical protein
MVGVGQVGYALLLQDGLFSRLSHSRLSHPHCGHIGRDDAEKKRWLMISDPPRHPAPTK